MRVVIASGKGGTGKTTVAVNLATSVGHVALLDCDVEAPNCDLFLRRELAVIEEVGVPVPIIDPDTCSHCGACTEFCRYNALALLPDRVMVFQELCHGCGGCLLVCPENAIREEHRVIGTVSRSEGDETTPCLLEGRLNIGEHQATPVIEAVKRLGGASGFRTGKMGAGSGLGHDGKRGEEDDIIVDAPPGTACAAVHAVRDADFCVLVTEPTPFGLHDLKLMEEVVQMMGIPFAVVINRDGVGDDGVLEHCTEKGIPVLMRIPQDISVARLYAEGHVVSGADGTWRKRFRDLFVTIRALASGEGCDGCGVEDEDDTGGDP